VIVLSAFHATGGGRFNYARAVWIAAQAVPLAFLTGLVEDRDALRATRSGVYAAATGFAIGGNTPPAATKASGDVVDGVRIPAMFGFGV